MKLLCKKLGISAIVISFLFVQPIASFQIHSCEIEVSTQSYRPLILLTQEVGDVRTFWERDFAAQIYYELNACLNAIGQHCYIYMQDTVISILGEEEAMSRSEVYRDEFDETIYPLVTDLTGNPDGLIGDIDGDSRIIILISENTMSYYSQYNEIDTTYSNLCEMVYIYYNTPEILGTIAHEFCHLIWFNYEFDEVHFTLEGLAEYARYYAGYFSPFNNLSSRSSYFLHQPEDSLVYFDIRPRDYGGTYLFTFYLAEQFGVQFLRDLVQQVDDGVQGIESTLRAAGHNITFNELYLDWITALIIDDPEFAGGRYGFQTIDTQVQGYTIIEELPFEVENLSLPYYGSHIHKLTYPQDKFAINIQQPSSVVVGISIVFHDIEGWHVQKKISNSSIEIHVGSSVDVAYVISSYMNASSTAGEIDFGAGPSIEIDLSIYESTLTTGLTTISGAPTDNSTWWNNSGVPLVLTFSIIGIVAIIYAKNRIRMKNPNR